MIRVETNSVRAVLAVSKALRSFERQFSDEVQPKIMIRFNGDELYFFVTNDRSYPFHYAEFNVPFKGRASQFRHTLAEGGNLLGLLKGEKDEEIEIGPTTGGFRMGEVTFESDLGKIGREIAVEMEDLDCEMESARLGPPLDSNMVSLLWRYIGSAAATNHERNSLHNAFVWNKKNWLAATNGHRLHMVSGLNGWFPKVTSEAQLTGWCLNCLSLLSKHLERPDLQPQMLCTPEIVKRGSKVQRFEKTNHQYTGFTIGDVTVVSYVPLEGVPDIHLVFERMGKKQLKMQFKVSDWHLFMESVRSVWPKSVKKECKLVMLHKDHIGIDIDTSLREDDPSKTVTVEMPVQWNGPDQVFLNINPFYIDDFIRRSGVDDDRKITMRVRNCKEPVKLIASKSLTAYIMPCGWNDDYGKPWGYGLENG